MDFKESIRKIIKESNGKIFSVSFIKKDGTKRNMVARLGVHKFLSGGTSTTEGIDKYIDVYDMNNAGYRKINIETIQSLKVNGIKYI